MPRRVATGVDPKRLAMIVAVLTRHARVPLAQADVFVNVAGGVRIDEPGADLAVALAIASAARSAPSSRATAAFGEIGLTGRLRPAAQARRRLEECAKLGIRTVIAPAETPAAKRRPRRREPTRFGAALGAGLSEAAPRGGLARSEQGFSRSRPKIPGNVRFLLYWSPHAGGSVTRRRIGEESRKTGRSEACTRSAIRSSIHITAQAPS